MSIADRLRDYNTSVSLAKSVIVSVHIVDTGGNPLWPRDQCELVTESAVLKIFVAWETFIEGCIADYMMGELSVLGNAITRFVNPVDYQHARMMVKLGNRYFDYGDLVKVKHLCKAVFDNGEPFYSAINGIWQHIIDMKKIRNAAAHITESTAKELVDIAIRKMGTPVTTISVYDLVIWTNPQSGLTLLEEYIAQMNAAVHLIAHA